MSSNHTASPPCAIGILGGGQLGRMLALAAARLGMDAHVYCPETDAPAARVAARTWFHQYDDIDALSDFARNCQYITFEFENVPLDTLRSISEAGGKIRPNARSLASGWDRLAEKTLFAKLGLRTAPHGLVTSENDAADAFDKFGPGMLKTRYSGYDGKGQAKTTTAQAARSAYRRLGNQPALYEEYIDFAGEMSVILARGADGQIAVYDPPRNTHRNGILVTSEVPSGFDTNVIEAGISSARRLAEELQHIGVLALELFVTSDGELIANEMAPRVHNSGHWTEEACITGQFEQHVRAVLGLPLGAARRILSARMDNILGTDAENALQRADPNLSVRLYGKRHSHTHRKMGHTVRIGNPI